MKTLIALLIAALALLPGPEGAVAQPYPDRPITIIVPFPAGNSSRPASLRRAASKRAARLRTLKSGGCGWWISITRK